MPQKHIYKCLNPECSDGKQEWFNNFVAMNSPMPSCPTCKSIRLHDGGIYTPPNVMVSAGQSREHAQNTDSNFRRIADKYGLTDMNNKNGQPVKRGAPAPVQQNAPPGATVNIGGYQVPFSAAAGGQCVHMPSMSQKIPTSNGAMPMKKDSKMMRDMTNVVASHKASA